MQEHSIKLQPWIRNVLVVSLILNFIIVGLLIGIFLHRHFNKPLHHQRPPNINRIVEAFPESEKRSLRFLMAKNRDDIKALHEKQRKLRKNIFETVNQEKIDKDELMSVFKEQRKLVNQTLELQHSKIIDILISMPLESRNTFLNRLPSALSLKKRNKENKEKKN